MGEGFEYQQPREGENSRSAQLQRFSHPGRFSAEEMGVPRGDGIVMPTKDWLRHNSWGDLQDGRVVYEPESHMAYWQTPNGRLHRMFTYVPMEYFEEAMHPPSGPFGKIQIALRESQADPVFSRRPGEVPKYLPQLQQAATEASFMVSNFQDRMFYARMTLAYALTQANTSDALWKLSDEELVREVGEVFDNHQIASLASITEAQDPLQVGDWIIQQAKVLRELVKGNVGFAQDAMHENTAMMTTITTYLYALARSGLDNPTLAQPLSDEELQRALVTLSRAEREPKNVENYTLLKASFSGTLNLALDACIAKRYPLAFAFGNEHTLTASHMEGKSYDERMRSTGTNVQGSRLQSIRALQERANKKIAEGSAIEILTVAKSVYTSLGESMLAIEGQGNMSRLRALLEEHNLSYPAGDLSHLSQYELDFLHISKLQELLSLWQDGKGNAHLETYLADLTAGVKSTADVVRGSIFASQKDIDGIVEEALSHPEIRLQLVLSRFEEGKGSAFDLVYFRNEQDKLEEIQRSLQPELRAVLGDRWQKASVTDILKAYYTKYKGKYPYASIHMYSDGSFSSGTYMQNGQPVQRTMEWQLYLLEEMSAAFAARAVFKGPKSPHVLSETERLANQ